jgi:hypothetical protein
MLSKVVAWCPARSSIETFASFTGTENNVLHTNMAFPFVPLIFSVIIIILAAWYLLAPWKWIVIGIVFVYLLYLLLGSGALLR